MSPVYYQYLIVGRGGGGPRSLTVWRASRNPYTLSAQIKQYPRDPISDPMSTFIPVFGGRKNDFYTPYIRHIRTISTKSDAQFETKLSQIYTRQSFQFQTATKPNLHLFIPMPIYKYNQTLYKLKFSYLLQDWTNTGTRFYVSEMYRSH